MRCTKLLMSHLLHPVGPFMIRSVSPVACSWPLSIGLVLVRDGRPVAMPPSPLAQGQKLNCLSYAPFHGNQAPFDQPLRIPDAQIESDLQKLAEVTSCIRTYSAARAQGKITRIAGKHGLKVLQGIWIGRNLADNRREIEGALAARPPSSRCDRGLHRR